MIEKVGPAGIKNWPKDDRPREKLLKKGAETEYEKDCEIQIASTEERLIFVYRGLKQTKLNSL